MVVNNHKIGRYHAIIKAIYDDNSIYYETDFTSESDLLESVSAYNWLIGEKVGLATDNPRILKDFEVIIGKENIIKELEREV